MKRSFQIISYVFFALALLFLIFGIYEIFQSYSYVTSYTAQGAGTTTTIFQYVLTSSMAYFGFGFVFLGIGAILYKQDRILSVKNAQPDPVIGEPEQVSKEQAPALPAEEPHETSEEAIAEAQSAIQEAPEEQNPEVPDVESPEITDEILEPAQPPDEVLESAQLTDEVHDEPSEESSHIPDKMNGSRITSDFIKGIFEDRD